MLSGFWVGKEEVGRPGKTHRLYVYGPVMSAKVCVCGCRRGVGERLTGAL